MFLPLTKKEMAERGWPQADFICVTGDSYVDHPSFGIAIISRLLEDMGFRAAILAQPLCDQDFTALGAPRLGFFVTGGNIDSMVSHYTAAKKKRSDDAYTAGNKAGKRPDRALLVYARAIRRLYPQAQILIGGLEASFRRFAHYDYWDDCVRPSILDESGADLLVYGMGERQTRAIAARLDQGEKLAGMTDIPGTCFMGETPLIPKNAVSCASFAKVAENRESFAKAYAIQAGEQDPVTGKAVVQKHGERYLIQNPPAQPLARAELDNVFELPFERMYHPSYEALGGVKAIEEVEFSIMHNRGCFGGCNFCSIAFHQGRFVTSRSRESVVREAADMTKSPRFKGYIHDVGGATANFREPACEKQREKGLCKNRRCLAPAPCPNLRADHSDYLRILRDLRALPGVKKVFVRSGLRFDYMELDRDKTFLNELVRHHVSGQLKVAPEHCSPRVLDLMGKPHIGVFERFMKDFYGATRKAGKKQYLVPYLMSSHPGATLTDAVALALFLKKHRIRPEQVQDFYPTPGTASTAMFYTGLDPFTMKPVYVAKTAEEKAMQRALLQYFMPKNRPLAAKALLRAGRGDLIGRGPECLIPPEPGAATPQRGGRSGAPNTKGKSGTAHRRKEGRR
ncbi:MAG: YgiQ family radical SAM protein [Oscillospiraceae bacterium]|jgi:uncharacterized radical SAM protein YgiQ|nr:YgiQ family radical SAM protein [Oscillospiraceae bacterium]